jgi:sugar phosphate isomerase/epimerase
MQISIAGYSFHGLVASGEMSIFGYLESCRYRYHLDTADIWAGMMGKDPELFLTDAFQQTVLRAVRERGLSVVNYHADHCHVWEEDATKRAANRALAERHIAFAEMLGARTIRIDPGGRERRWSQEAFDTIASTYRTWARRAHDLGYRIGPETHWGAGDHVDNQLQLHKAVDSPGYGILLHMGKPNEMSPDAFDRALAPYAMHTHLPQQTCEERLATALQILKEANYTGVLGVEHHSGKNELAEVAHQLSAVRRALSAA